MADGEKLQFKAEVRELLGLMINSIYSNREIFVRELIANAADAIDKARFEALTKPELVREWEIRIDADKEAGTLTFADNGTGMTKDELIENLGTIAHSGTKAFAEALKNAKNSDSPELIGQFGVGFYSAFMAADKVTVNTKKDGSDKAFCWISDGKNDFSISEIEKSTPGTEIILTLKEDYKEFLDYWKVSETVRKYSDFIEYPVKMRHTVKKDEKDEIEDSTLNTMKAIWLRNESDVKDDEYNSFYQHLSGDFNAPLKRIIFNAEGASEFKSLLFIAPQMPFSYKMGMRDKKSLSLYVRRVFITDECPNLLPEYMKFVSGVVDSSDLPLNISRETLQDNPQIARIGRSIAKRVLSELEKMLGNERESYEKFYREFHAMLKGGIHTDHANKEKLENLLMFESMNNPDGKLITLKEYSDAMKPDQQAIYYISGDNRQTLEHSAQLEVFRKQGFDVLFLTEPMDEIIMDDIAKYAEKDLKNVARGDVKFSDSVQKEMEEKTKKAADENKDLVEYLKKTLEDKVKDVRFSARLTESPCCLVSDAYDPSISMQRIMKAMGQDSGPVKRILELNPDNVLVGSLKKLFAKDSSSTLLTDMAKHLYDTALVAEGAPVPDPAEFSRRTVALMSGSIEKTIGE